MSIEILKAGALSTVQDSGRKDVGAMGFCSCGAMDLHSMYIANRLVGNYKNCATVEMTIIGITAKFSESCLIALSGGNFDANINGKIIRNNKAYRINAGSILSIGSAKDGARCYLAVSGGIEVPYVMGSKSTDLKIGIGGFCGRKLKQGDRLNIGSMNMPIKHIEKCQIDEDSFGSSYVLRCVLGPQDKMFTKSDLKLFFSQKYTVSNQCDRMGSKLLGEHLKGINGMDIISDGIVSGSVQISGNGLPIVLASDHQTTGGYAKIATVISTDLWHFAQAKPGDSVQFKQISIKEAEKTAKREKKYFNNLFFWYNISR